MTPGKLTRKWFKEFGVALEPSIITASLYALLVGVMSGLVAQGLGYSVLITRPHGDHTYDGKPVAICEIADAAERGVIVLASLRQMRKTRLAAAFESKYGESHDYHPEPTTWDGGGLWVLRPTVAFAWNTFPTGLTRWRFP